MDDASEDLAAWLAARPPRLEITWHSDHLGVERPWASGWVDVLSEMMVDLPYNWLWTITWEDQDPDPADDDGARWDFQWPPDLVVYRVWEHDWDWPGHETFTGPEILSLPVEAGGNMTAGQAAELQLALDRCSPRAAVYGSPGWSPAAISAALEFWAEVGTSAGRCRPSCNGPSHDRRHPPRRSQQLPRR